MLSFFSSSLCITQTRTSNKKINNDRCDGFRKEETINKKKWKNKSRKETFFPSSQRKIRKIIKILKEDHDCCQTEEVKKLIWRKRGWENERKIQFINEKEYKRHLQA